MDVVQATLGGDGLARLEKRDDRRGVEGRRHHQYGQVLANRVPDLGEHREGQVCLQAALVEFVQYDRRNVGEKGVVQELSQEDPLGDEANPRARAGLAVVADLVPDLVPHPAVPLERDPPRCRARREPARLQDPDFTIEAVIDERCGDARRLSRARRRRQHNRAAPFDSGE